MSKSTRFICFALATTVMLTGCSPTAEEQYEQAVKYDMGDGVAEDDVKAVSLYREAAEQGHVEAQFYLGEKNSTGEGLPQDDTQAVAWWQKAAAQGFPPAMNNLGSMYTLGRGVLKDEAQALVWYQKAADQGYAQAQYNIGGMYFQGTKPLHQDDKQAVVWWQKAAEQGHAMAEYELGAMYTKGRGVLKDEVLGAAWYLKSAQQGVVIAQYKLGLAYANGSGVPQDAEKAVDWYTRAADQGNAEAQFNLGMMYKNGEGITKDEQQAYMWLKEAAAQGHKNALYLTSAYFEGNYLIVTGVKPFQWLHEDDLNRISTQIRLDLKENTSLTKRILNELSDIAERHMLIRNDRSADPMEVFSYDIALLSYKEDGISYKEYFNESVKTTCAKDAAQGALYVARMAELRVPKHLILERDKLNKTIFRECQHAWAQSQPNHLTRYP